jgi:ferredoxin
MNVEIRFFSATGITKKVVTEFARGLGCNERFLDITLPKNRNEGTSCDTDLEVIAVPVHGERIPGFLYRYLCSIKGNNRPLVTIAVYGNMGIGISLGQFEHLAQKTGFRLVSAAALVGEHTFCRFGALQQIQGAALRQAQRNVNHVGMGRPDKFDLQEIYSFGQKVRSKLDQGLVETISLPKPITPMFIAGFPERGTRFIVRQPDADPKVCESCGVCEKKCPVGAIDPETFEIDGTICIRCMACVHNCPARARASQFKSNMIDCAFEWLGHKPKQNHIFY